MNKETQKLIENASKLSERFDQESCGFTQKEQFLAALLFLYQAVDGSEELTKAMEHLNVGCPEMFGPIELAMDEIGVEFDADGTLIPADETEEERLVRIYGGPGRLA